MSKLKFKVTIKIDLIYEKRTRTGEKNMSNITIEIIQKLRNRTGVGIADCKNALSQTNGDIEKAVDVLRQKGVAVAAKRGDNLTENGLVQGFKNDLGSSLIEISCETDFSARTDSMKKFSKIVAETIVEKPVINLDDILSLVSSEQKLTIKEHLDDLVAKICENIKISKANTIQASPNTVSNIYIHPDHTVGTMIEITANKNLSSTEKEKIEALAKDLCMQIAVTNPLAIKSSDLSEEALVREKNNAEALAKTSGKPESFWEKIIDGKLRKFYEEACLLNQKFIKDDSVSVEKKLSNLAKELNIESLNITKIERIGIKR